MSQNITLLTSVKLPKKGNNIQTWNAI